MSDVESEKVREVVLGGGMSRRKCMGRTSFPL